MAACIMRAKKNAVIVADLEGAKPPHPCFVRPLLYLESALSLRASGYPPMHRRMHGSCN